MELLIRVKTEAELEALKQTGAEIVNVKGKTEEGGKADEQASIKKKDLLGNLKQLRHEIPLVGTAITLLKNPFVILGLTLSAAISAWKQYRAAQLEAAANAHAFAMLATNFASTEKFANDAATAAQAFKKEIVEIVTNAPSAEQAFGSINTKIERTAKLLKEEREERKKLALMEVELQETLGKLTPEAAARKKAGIEIAFAGQDRAAARATTEALIQASNVATIGAGLKRQGLESELAGKRGELVAEQELAAPILGSGEIKGEADMVIERAKKRILKIDKQMSEMEVDLPGIDKELAEARKDPVHNVQRIQFLEGRLNTYGALTGERGGQLAIIQSAEALKEATDKRVKDAGAAIAELEKRIKELSTFIASETDKNKGRASDLADQTASDATIMGLQQRGSALKTTIERRKEAQRLNMSLPEDMPPATISEESQIYQRDRHYAAIRARNANAVSVNPASVVPDFQLRRMWDELMRAQQTNSAVTIEKIQALTKSYNQATQKMNEIGAPTRNASDRR